MAVGDGGFKIAFQGFDKNEVNEYISNLRKKMNELESEMKENDGKVRAAVKTADEAEDKIRQIEKKSSERIAELEAQIKSERKNSEELLDRIDELKRKVKNGGSVFAGTSSAEAQKQASEIIVKANKTAQETVDAANKIAREVIDKAKNTAQEIIANAKNVPVSGGSSVVNLDGFMSALKNYLDEINSGYKAICKKAEEISAENTETSSAAEIEIPDFSDIETPNAKAPEAEVPEFSHPEPAKEISFDDILSESADSSDDDMMGGFGSIVDQVSEVKENDTSEHSKAAFDLDFDAELIAQTVPSSSLMNNDISEDLLEAVRKEEEKYAVRPTPEENRKDFDMDMSAAPEEDDGADAMRRMLEQAEAAFGNMSGGSIEFDEEPQEETSAKTYSEPRSDNSNPWEDLQKQLEAMEQTGNFGGEEQSPEKSPTETEIEDPQTPTADDSSIWDFNISTDDNSDDDMSTDMFGSF